MWWKFGASLLWACSGPTILWMSSKTDRHDCWDLEIKFKMMTVASSWASEVDDSKYCIFPRLHILTRVFVQPCLGGDGKTLMFVNVNPEVASLQETVCSLRFATKVNACQTAARGGAKRHMSVEARSSLQVQLQYCIRLYLLLSISILVTEFLFVPHSLLTIYAQEFENTH